MIKLSAHLCAEIVHLSGLHVRDDLQARRCVGKVAIVQAKPLGRQPIDAMRVEGARAPHDAVHLVPLVEEQLSEV